MGIEPTLSHLRCDALPIKLSSPLGARWWEGRYTSASAFFFFFFFSKEKKKKKSRDLHTSAIVMIP